MVNLNGWLVLLMWCLLQLKTDGMVLQRPPPSGTQAMERREFRLGTDEPKREAIGSQVVTSSELPKQIPAPPHPVQLSSTPQYQDDNRISDTLQFKLLWVTPEMNPFRNEKLSPLYERNTLA